MEIKKELPKKDRILLAAEVVFSKYGFEKATLDEIIALADVGKGTVYKYYGNKEQLFYKLIQSKNVPFVERLKKTVEKETVLQKKIEAYLLEMIDFYRENSSLWQSIFFEMMGEHHGAMVCLVDGKTVVKSTFAIEVTEELKEQILRYHYILDDAFSILSKELSEATASGMIKNGNPVIRANHLLCGIAMVMFHHRDEVMNQTSEEIAKICADRFLHGECINQK